MKHVCSRNFIRSLVSKYGRHTVYTHDGIRYPQACTILHLKHRLHFSLAKSMIDWKSNEYFKDRIECFDDYYPSTNNNNCDLAYVHNWIKLFVYLCNERIKNSILFKIRGEVVLS